MPAEMRSFNLSHLTQLKSQFGKGAQSQASAESSNDFISSLRQEQSNNQQYQVNNQTQSNQSNQRNQQNNSDSLARESRVRKNNSQNKSNNLKQENRVKEQNQQNKADDEVRNREETAEIKEQRSSSDRLESKLKEKGIISEEKLERIKKLLAEDVENLSDKDLEALLANLTKMLEKLSQQLEEVEIKLEKDMLNKEQIEKIMKSITANQDKLQKLVNSFSKDESNQFKSLLKDLESMQEKLLSNQTQQSKEGAAKTEAKLKNNFKDSLQDLKRLLQKTNAKVVQSNTNSENSQNLSKQKILSQFNLAELNQKQKNVKAKKESSLSQINLKGLGKEVGEALLKKESINLEDLSSKQQNVDLKTVTKKNESSNFNLSNFNLGQFNTDTKVFTQTSTKSMAAKTVNLQNILDQMNNKMNFTAMKQGNKVTMQLEPEFLGKIQMEVGVEDGAVTAKILAESNGVKDLLNGNLMRLKSALEEKGIEIDQFDVSVGYQEEELAEQDNSQQDFLFKQQQEKNKLNKFSLEREGQSSSAEDESEEETTIEDEVNYMA